MTGPRVVGVLVGLVGVITMIGGKALFSLGINVIAQVAILGAAISYAFAGIFGRRFSALGVFADSNGHRSSECFQYHPSAGDVDG